MATEVAAVGVSGAPATGQVENKGLKTNAIGYVSNIVIGVASTAPAYSLAATLGFIVADKGVTTHAPGVLLASFVPMLLISLAYRYLNKADPDAGTTFAWTTRAFGPTFGWLNGWAIFLADLLVMASLGYIAATYTYLLFEWHYGETHVWVALVGCILWIWLMTWICHRGIELSARIQQLLLTFEFVMLMIFAIVALIDVYSGTAAAHSIKPSADWFNPFAMNFGDLVVAMLLGIFIYWGWDSGVAVNEESEDSNEGPGRAAVVSTVLLVLIYLLVSAGAQSYHGTAFISSEENASDVLHALGKGVLGSVGVRFLIVAVLTSAAASTQTTILPTARTTLSMAKWGAIPSVIGRIHPRFLTPTVSTWGFGILSVLVAVPLILISETVLELAVVALGIPVCFYYGSTGFASLWYYRREIFDSPRKLIFVGLLPLLGGLIMYGIGIYAIKYYGHKANSEGKIYLGLTLPLWFGGVGMIIGLVLAFVSRLYFGPFFSRKTETAPAGLLDAPVERAPAHLMGREHVTTPEHPFTPEAEDEPAGPPGAPPGG
ncbi:MAG TPA: APC family permease [Solirubrobacteraceae bacterium]|jgi:amino acid transporter|nr:APC family permease [Solirubrobacteraceae bacterium]